MKPYVYLYKSINGNYCYDVNRDTIIEINENIYSYLNTCENSPLVIEENSVLNAEDREALEDLVRQGFLSDHRVGNITHRYAKDAEFYVKNRMVSLLLQVTQSCNLLCSYCPYANKTDGKFQRNHSSKKMNWDIAKKSIDLFLECSSEIDDVYIGFYGGEPFLNFPLIKQVVEYADKAFAGKIIGYTLTTNGTLLTDEIVDFLTNHNFYITFSIDGPAALHDKHRKKSDGTGSYSDAVKNLKRLVCAFEDEAEKRINVNTVINTENDLDQLFELFDDSFFVDHKINIKPNIVSSDKLEKKIGVSNDFIEKFNYRCFVSLMKNLGVVKNINLDPISNEFGLETIKKMEEIYERKDILSDTAAPRGPCIPGQRKLFVNADGDMYPCEKVNELADEQKIGNINIGFDFDKIDKILNIARITESQCRNCFAFRHCSVCVIHCSDENGISSEAKLKHCQNIKKKFVKSLRLKALIMEINMLYKRKIKI